LAAIDRADDNYALALLDLSTGELSACSMAGSASLVAELARAEPAELLLPAALAELSGALKTALGRAALRRDDNLADDDVPHYLDGSVARPLYQDAVGEHTLAALRATARLLRFANRSMPEATLPVVRLAHHDPDAFMRIGETAQAHLELVRDAEGGKKGALLSVIDKTITPAGARMLRKHLLSPLLEVAAIRRRHDAVEQFLRHGRARQQLREVLAAVADIDRLAIRATLGEATPRDLGNLRDSLLAAPLAQQAVASIEGLSTDDAAPMFNLDVDLLPQLAAHLDAGLVDDPPARVSDGNLFREGFDQALDEVDQLRQSGTALLGALESRLREETSIASLKVKHTRAFGWYIEVTRANVDKVPESWRRRQTLTHVERYLSDELQDLADRVEGAAEQHAELEAALFVTLVEEVARSAQQLHALATTLAQWDVSAGLAQVAADYDYVRPTVDDSDEVTLRDARHPVVERCLPGGQFVPNDTALQVSGERLWVITGPNMAGKSTLMRQVALNVIMAQAGAFVAAKQARIGVVDRVLSRVGANDNL
ncbi:MAG TPA: DNA mismatch repair protein MutS, partial [Sorangium sp.]|nr:DNA mismatch repair protein MutS [Sorangium sp.]